MNALVINPFSPTLIDSSLGLLDLHGRVLLTVWQTAHDDFSLDYIHGSTSYGVLHIAKNTAVANINMLWEL